MNLDDYAAALDAIDTEEAKVPITLRLTPTMEARVIRIIATHPRFEIARDLTQKAVLFDKSKAMREALAYWIQAHESEADADLEGHILSRYGFENSREWIKWVNNLQPSDVPKAHRERTMAKLRVVAEYVDSVQTSTLASQKLNQLENL